jgi:hypothetical protein
MPRESMDHVFQVPAAGSLAGEEARAIHELAPLVRYAATMKTFDVGS